MDRIEHIDEKKIDIQQLDDIKDQTPEDLAHDDCGQTPTGYEHLSEWETLKVFKRTALVCFALAFTACADGYEIGMANNINGNRGFNEYFGIQEIDGVTSLAARQLAIWSPISATGQVLGQVLTPFLSAKFGRKSCLFAIWFAATLSVLIQTVSKNWIHWAASKPFTGFTVGALQTVIPMYICELAPVKIRGSLIALYNFWFQLGNFFPPIVFQILTKQNRQSEWRMPVYTQWATSAIMAVIYTFIPESPVWCAKNGRKEKGVAILAKLNGGVPDYDAEFQYDILAKSLAYEKKQQELVRKERFYNIFIGTDLLRTIISAWPTTAFQFLGLGLFLSYGVIFYQAAGVEDPFTVVIANNCITLGCIIPVIIFIDKIGRRRFTIGGLNVMWISCLVTGILGVVPSSKATDIMLVVSSCFWTLGLQVGATGAYGYLVETSRASLREYTAGVAYGISSVIGNVWGILIPYMLNEADWNWGLRTGFFFFGVGAVFALGSWFLLPEMTQRSAAELNELFARKIKPWRFHKTQTERQAAQTAASQGDDDA